MTHVDGPLELSMGRDAASLIIVNEEGKVLWGRRGDYAPFLAGYWAFVGGMASSKDYLDGETRLQTLKRTAIREAGEELGIDFSHIDTLLQDLEWVGQWSTHPYLPKLITCEFFSISATQLGMVKGTEPNFNHRDGELNQLEWRSGMEMLQRWKLGEVTFAPPTLAICRSLAENYPLQEANQRNHLLKHLNQVSSFIQLIPLKTPTLPPATHTNVYLLGEKEFYLVDPASRNDDELSQLFKIIEYRELNGDQLVGLILTHHHQDHVGGLKKVSEHYQVPVYAHKNTAKLLKLQGVTLLDEGDTIRWLQYDLSSDYAEIWITPGHAPGHLCLLHSQTETAIVGDMVAGVGTIVIDPDDGDMADYLHSLSRLRRRGLRRLLPSHGPPLAVPKVILSHYIEHRQAREEKVWRALPQFQSITRGGGEIRWLTLAEIVDQAYAEAAPMVKKGPYGGLAGRSALSHLIHLQKQGRALSSDPSPTIKSRWIAHHQSLNHVSESTMRLMSMMTTLRVQCPWDKAQTLESLKRYLIEETYEVLDSMDHAQEHCEELGDLFFQILFQSIIREQEGRFTLSDVMDALAAKLSRRHPHVFGDLQADDPEQVRGLWTRIKEKERANKGNKKEESSILDGVPKSAPALLRAQIIGEKASSIGFDWPSLSGALEKVDEERLEVQEAIEVGQKAEILAEVGDLFFAVVNVCRHLQISPEVALESTNRTFSSRFRYVESLARQRSLKLENLNIDQLEELWSEAKLKLKK